MILWGICMMCMGLTYNFSGLMAARFFLGVAEAGLFPGVNYYLSCWYRRREFGVRAAIFFSAAALSGSFGGLLAYLLEKMDGIGGKQGWAWIFIIEGLVTVLVGVASFWMVQDFPDNAKFLTPDDKARVQRRLKADKQSAAEHESFHTKYIWAALGDPKTYLSCLVYMGTDGALYACMAASSTTPKVDQAIANHYFSQPVPSGTSARANKAMCPLLIQVLDHHQWPRDLHGCAVAASDNPALCRRDDFDSGGWFRRRPHAAARLDQHAHLGPWYHWLRHAIRRAKCWYTLCWYVQCTQSF